MLVLFKKLFPNSTIGQFYKNAFKERLNWKLFTFTTVVHVLIMSGSVGIAALTTGLLYGLEDLSFGAIVTNIFLSVVTGATGEESCWRGYLQPSFEKKYSAVKSSLIVGFIWSFWHIPLWLANVGSEPVGAFILNTVSFVIFTIAIAVVMGICYNRCRNLFIPIWLHFISNFMLTLFTGDGLYIQIWCAVLYTFVAVGYSVWHKKTSREN